MSGSSPAVMLGPSASEQWLDAPEHLAFVLARYRAAAGLIGGARTVLELGCGEGIGSRILARGRSLYHGIDHDEAALGHARRLAAERPCSLLHYAPADVRAPGAGRGWDAVVALDVIEHLDRAGGARMVEAARRALASTGVLVVGTPSARFDGLASARSRAEHVLTYEHEALLALVGRSFGVVQSFGMQDTGLHLGHPDARHYLLMVGIAPR